MGSLGLFYTVGEGHAQVGKVDMHTAMCQCQLMIQLSHHPDSWINKPLWFERKTHKESTVYHGLLCLHMASYSLTEWHQVYFEWWVGVEGSRGQRNDLITTKWCLDHLAMSSSHPVCQNIPSSTSPEFLPFEWNAFVRIWKTVLHLFRGKEKKLVLRPIRLKKEDRIILNITRRIELPNKTAKIPQSEVHNPPILENPLKTDFSRKSWIILHWEGSTCMTIRIVATSGDRVMRGDEEGSGMRWPISEMKKVS